MCISVDITDNKPFFFFLSVSMLHLLTFSSCIQSERNMFVPEVVTAFTAYDSVYQERKYSYEERR